MEAGSGDCKSMDMVVSNNKTSSSIATTSQQHTTMNHENQNEPKADLCMKRKAGEIEPDRSMENSIRNTHHRFGAPACNSSIPNRQGAPPLKKRLSLDLLSDASALLALGLGPSKIQEIVKQQECAAATNMTEATMKDPVTDITMAVATKYLNGGTSSINTSQVPQVKPMNSHAPTSLQALDSSNDSHSAKQENHSNGNTTTATKESEPVVLKQKPPVMDQEGVEVKQDHPTPMQTDEPPPPSEATTSKTTPVQEPQEPNVGSAEQEAPIRTVSETEHSVKEQSQHEAKVEDAKMDEPPMPSVSAGIADAAKESKTSMPDEESKASMPVEEMKKDSAATADTSEESKSSMPVEEMKKDSAATADTSEESKSLMPVEETKASMPADEAKKDSDETAGTSEESKKSMLVEESKASMPDDDETKKDTTADTSTGLEKSKSSMQVEESKASDDEVKKDTPMQSLPVADKSFQEPQSTSVDNAMEIEQIQQPVSDATKTTDVVDKEVNTAKVDETQQKETPIPPVSSQGEIVVPATTADSFTFEESKISMPVEESKACIQDDEVKQDDTPMESVSEADNSVQAPQRTLTDDDLKKDAPTLQQPVSDAEDTTTDAAFKEESQDKSKADEAEQKDTPMPSVPSQADHLVSDATADNVGESKTPISVEESKTSIEDDEAQKDTPMQSVPETKVQAPQSTPTDNLKEDASKMKQPVSNATGTSDAVVQEESQNRAKADEAEQKDTPTPSVSSLAESVTVDEETNPTTVDAKADEAAQKDTPMVLESQEDTEVVNEEPKTTAVGGDDTKEEPMQALPTGGNSVEAAFQKPLDSEVKIDAAIKSAQASNASVQNDTAPNEEAPKEEKPLKETVKETHDESVVETVKEANDECAVAMAADENAAIKETKQEDKQQVSTVEPVKTEILETTAATNDTVIGVEEGDSGPTNGIAQEPAPEEKKEAMDIDEPPVEESEGENQAPINTGEPKLENRESMTANEMLTEQNQGSEQPETNDQAHEQEMPVDESVEDKNEDNKESIATDEYAEKTKEADPEAMTIDKTVKETIEAKEAPELSNEPSDETDVKRGEPMTSDKPVKIMEEDNGEPMVVDEPIAETTAADSGETSEKIQKLVSKEEPETSCTPSASDEKNADSSGSVIDNINGSSLAIDSAESPEEASGGEKNANSSEGINVNMNGSSKSAMDTESAKSHELSKGAGAYVLDVEQADMSWLTKNQSTPLEEEPPDEKNADASKGVNVNMNGSSKPAMDSDSTRSHGEAISDEKNADESKGVNVNMNGSSKSAMDIDSAKSHEEDSAKAHEEASVNQTNVDSTEGVDGMNGSSKSAMDVDSARSQEASETEPSTVGESQTAPNEEKKTKKKHMNPQVLEIRKRIQFGCRDNDLSAAMEAYDEANEKNIKVEAQSFYNLLNLCDGLEQSVHIGTPKDKSTTPEDNAEVPTIDGATRLKFAFRLRDHMKELNLPLNEAAYSAIVKLLSKAKEYDRALEILEESETVQQCKPKLRLYSSLLVAYCEGGRMLEALEIWKKLVGRKLQATEKEYAALMQCATSSGDCIVFERVLTDLAEDVLVPAKATVSRILEWFELAHSFYKTPLTKRRADATKVKEYLEQIHKCEIETPPNMGPVVNVNGWQISSACPIDMKSGVLQTGCFKGYKLNPFIISQRAWNEMRDMNEKIVTEGQVEGHNTAFQGGKKGKKRMDFSPQKRRMEWDHFTKFLESIGHVDVVIDGANVGCFAKNFAGAPKHIDYLQIDWIVQHFSKVGKKVLLVLHERHFAMNQMPDKFRWLEQKWMKNRNLYKTPRGMNDDWFWLHVAYTHRSLVVSNDEMRDHHFQMLAPRTFLRWKERHHAHFDFGNWIVGEDGRRQREVLLTLPEAYSRRLQRVEDGLVIPLAKRGDSNRFIDGTHIANDDEPEEETYLCIRPNQQA